MTVLVNEKKHIKHAALALKNDYFSLAINFESMRPSLPDIQSHILLSKKRKLKVTGTSSGDFSPQFRFSRNLEAEVIFKAQRFGLQVALNKQGKCALGARPRQHFSSAFRSAVIASTAGY